jgi:hypothetical protein
MAENGGADQHHVANLTTQLRSISMMLGAVENGDYSRRLTVKLAAKRLKYATRLTAGRAFGTAVGGTGTNNQTRRVVG